LITSSDRRARAQKANLAPKSPPKATMQRQTRATTINIMVFYIILDKTPEKMLALSISFEIHLRKGQKYILQTRLCPNSVDGKKLMSSEHYAK
jgi:hypothetical protein